MARLKYPLPPFMPAGKIIQKGRWKDTGEWDDDKTFFGTGDPDPSPPPP